MRSDYPRPTLTQQRRSSAVHDVWQLPSKTSQRDVTFVLVNHDTSRREKELIHAKCKAHAARAAHKRKATARDNVQIRVQEVFEGTEHRRKNVIEPHNFVLVEAWNGSTAPTSKVKPSILPDFWQWSQGYRYDPFCCIPWARTREERLTVDASELCL